jgi:hypothetical protein
MFTMELLMYCTPMAITINPIIREIATMPEAPNILER